MAFNFRQSNLRHLLRLPVTATVFLLSMVTARRSNRWVFGRKGMFGGNSRYLMEYVTEHHPEVECVWLAHSEEELRAARASGVRAELAGSWRGWLLALTAKVGIVSLGFGDLNRAACGGMFVVQLWHGLPLKKLGLDSPVSTAVGQGKFGRSLEPLVRILYRFLQSRYKLFTAPSEIVATRYESAFALHPGCVALTGEPKTDIILGPNTRGPCFYWQSKMRRTFQIGQDTRILMYAPTWREGGGLSLLPSSKIADKLDTLMRQNDAHFLIRGHYGDVDSALSGTLRRNISVMSFREFNDVNYLLSGIDILISDYSGIMMDFALLGRPIIFFAPDIEAYVGARGLYESYETFTGGGGWANDWPELLSDLELCLKDDRRFAANALYISKRYNGQIDLGNRRRVYEEIVSRLGGPMSAKSIEAVTNFVSVENAPSVRQIGRLGATSQPATRTNSEWDEVR